ncbi:MAG: hypothetical protein E7617_07440 [Ruminococcaceae bacterium]|nr:hypothetical protein [Oscillospiraceae bacterium]
MEKRITESDLMLAIGELPEELVKYPASTTARYKIIKRLSAVAACFIVAVSLILIYPGLPKFDGMGGNAMDSAPSHGNSSDMNNAPTQNGNGSGKIESVHVGDISDSPLKFVIEESYIFYKTGIFENNYLQISENADGDILALLPRSIGESYSITALNEGGSKIDIEWQLTEEAALLEIPREVCAVLLESDEVEFGIELLIGIDGGKHTVTVRKLSSIGTGST